MSEKLPLYAYAYSEQKSLTELFFWYEFRGMKFLLIVLDEGLSNELPMVMISTEGENQAFPLLMSHSILAVLANEDEIPAEIKNKVESLRKKD